MGKIVNISEAATLALHSLVFIAKSQHLVNAIEISGLAHFSKNHLSKVLQIMVRNNYLMSERGPRGGFKLKKPAQEISLLEIYELFDGKIYSGGCALQGIETCIFSNCVFGSLTTTFANEFENYLKNKTIADILN